MSNIEHSSEKIKQLEDEVKWLKQDVEIWIDAAKRVPDANKIMLLGQDLAAATASLSQARARADKLETLHRKEQGLLLRLFELSESGDWAQIKQRLQSFHNEWEHGDKNDR